MARLSSPSKRTPATQRQTPEQVLQTLESLESAHHDNITIIKISEPISSALTTTENTAAAAVRTSDVSNSSLDNPTPASLEADLLHYRELFAKLRFSYVEQVTKEKFIRAIVGDPPLIVTPQENADLEERNVLAKAALKALKTEVVDMISELEVRGRALASRYEAIQLDTVALKDLVSGGRMEELEGRIAELKAQEDVRSDGGDESAMNMPLGKTPTPVL